MQEKTMDSVVTDEEKILYLSLQNAFSYMWNYSCIVSLGILTFTK
jgi:hypothetical protein